jgi:hypothetical protein
MSDPAIITKLNSLNTDIQDPNFTSNNPNEYTYLDNLKKNVLTNYTSNIALSKQVTNTIDLMKGNFNDRIKKIDDINQRKLEISRFYTLKYSKEISILQKIVFICGVGLIGCLLFNIGMISNNFLSLYLGIVLAIGFVVVFYNLWDFYVRDNNVFDEYDYGIYGSKPVTTQVLPSNSQSMVNNEIPDLKC